MGGEVASLSYEHTKKYESTKKLHKIKESEKIFRTFVPFRTFVRICERSEQKNIWQKNQQQNQKRQQSKNEPPGLRNLPNPPSQLRQLQLQKKWQRKRK